MPFLDAVPDLLRRLREPEQLAVLGVDDALVDQEIEIDRPAPIALADEDHRDRLDLAGLHQGQGFKQFVQRAEAAGKGGGAWKIVGIVVGVGCGSLILIVGILAAFLLPALFKAQESARRAYCLNNIRQITLAMIQYAGEYDDDFPSSLVDDAEAPQRRLARLLALGYLNAPKVFKCPSAQYDERPDRNRLDGENLTNSSLESIADVYLGDGWCSYGIDVRLNHTHAASRAMVADRPHRDYWGPGVSSPGAGKPGSNSQNHRGDGQNIAYNDGHVTWSPTCKDDANIDPNIYGSNPEVNPLDDSNIDFGTKPRE